MQKGKAKASSQGQRTSVDDPMNDEYRPSAVGGSLDDNYKSLGAQDLPNLTAPDDDIEQRTIYDLK